MIEQAMLLSMNYYKKFKPFTGSDDGMRFRIVSEKGENEEPDRFKISVWPEPFCYEKADRAEMTEKIIPFTQEDFSGIADYLNSMWPLVTGKDRDS